MMNHALPKQNLADREWNSMQWGNFQTNIDFLRKVGILGHAPMTILEIGCGRGKLLNSLQQAGHTAMGIDVDEQPISTCRTSYPNLTVQVASGDAIPFPNASFDVVLSFDVFEHIRDSDRHLREVTRVLKPGGMYLLQTPNKWTNVPFEILRHWRKYKMGPVAGYRELLKEHCSLHNFWELKRRFVGNGFVPTMYDIPVVNEYFTEKMHTYFGGFATPLLTLFNPDHLPQPLRTNFYLKAERMQ